MIVFENERAEKILKAYVPQALLDEKPIVAGGFILALFYKLIIDDSISEKEFDREVKMLTERKDPYNSDKPFNMKFGDIDIWFLGENKIRDTELFKRAFASAYENDKDTFSLFSQLGVSVSNLFATKYGLGTLQRSTGWALTYRSNRELIQIVKKKVESVDILLSSFDIDNCKIAYYDGKFYAKECMVLATKNEMIEPSERLSETSLFNRMWVAKRAYKYSTRYSYTFSETMCEDMVQLYSDMQSVSANTLKDPDYFSKLSDKEKAMIQNYSSAYAQNKASMDEATLLLLHRTIHSLEQMFYLLCAMPNFKMESVCFLMGTKNDVMLDEIARCIEKIKLDAPTKSETNCVEKTWDIVPANESEILF